MDLDLNDEQQMLQGMVRDLCSKLSAPDAVRKLEDDPVGYDEQLWKQLVELDLLGLLLPESFGGSGMSLIEGVVVYTELGRALAPSPHFVSSVLCGGVLVKSGNADLQAEWLPKIASGEAILSAAWLEPENGFGPKGVQLRATVGADGGYEITGEKRHVAFASSADRFLVPVRVGDGATDVDIVIVDAKAAGITLTQQTTVASDTQYKVVFDGVTVPASAKVGGWDAWELALQDAMVLAAAQAIGGAQASLELTVQYSKDRVQFDKPLGAFQSLAHYMADARTSIDGAEVLVFEAAWAGSEGRPEAAKLAAMAKLFSGQTYRDTTAMSLQIHGGIGFTLECDAQLYFRRAKALQLNWGDDRYCEELIAAAVLD